MKIKDLLTIMVACIVVPIHTVMWYFPTWLFARYITEDWLISPRDLWEDITWDIFHNEVEIS